MMTQTTGKALYASIIAISRQGLFLLPCLFIFSRFLGLGFFGIQVSIPVADFLGFLLSIPITAIVFGQMKEEPLSPNDQIAKVGPV
jgi:Na+-driven multidrug efflux pump